MRWATGGSADCPKHRAYLDAFYIGVYCVTNRQYRAFVKATGHRAPNKATSGSAVWAKHRCPGNLLDHPVVCVNWDDATAYAAWAGCTLPTEAQWEKAARGPQGLVYPWGNEWDADKCRSNTNKGNKRTCAVWAYPAGVSGYGTLNQSGNVWEWCRDWSGEKYYSDVGAAKNPEGPATGSDRVNRGGGWCFNLAQHFRGADRFWLYPAYRYGYLGFRLVRTV